MRISLLLVVLFVAQYVSAQHSLKKLPYPVNTDVYDEICPILSYSEDELFFTRSQYPGFQRTLIENGKDLFTTYNENRYNQRLKTIYSMIKGSRVEDVVKSSFNQDVFFSHYYKGEIFNVFHPIHPLNNALPNSICSHYGDGDSYVVINEFPKDGGVGAGFSTVEKLSDLQFSHPEPLKIQDFDLVGGDVNLAISTDKEYIILAMQNQETLGDMDLYLCIKGYQGVYSSPMHLGNTLNSPYREATPFFSQDNKKLYFASNKPGGVGGMDIYVSERLDYSFRSWSEPKPIGRPVNSLFNDSHPHVTIDEQDILFTSDRDGSSDIFYAKLVRDDSLAFDIDIYVVAVKDGVKTRTHARIYWTEAYKPTYDHFFNSRDGKYNYTFTENKPMQFKAESRGFISETIILDPQELMMAGIREMTLELFMEKGKGREPVLKRQGYKELMEKIAQKQALTIPKDSTELAQDSVERREKDDLLPLVLNSTVVLKNILFERAKPKVLPVSYPTLLKLANTIKRRPDVIVQIEGHTDNVGETQAKIDLSLARANAIREFLLTNGVNPSQVRTKGFGDTRPITKNRNEEEKAQNRRVEIRVLQQK